MVLWRGYEFQQDKDIMGLYCRYKNFALLDFGECIGYGKKIFNNYYLFIKLHFPKCPNTQLLDMLDGLMKRTFSVRLLSQKQFINLNPAKIGHTMVIDLEKSEEELWNSLKKKKRNAIRQGYRRGTRATIIDESRLEEWLNVYISTVKRKDFSQLPKELLLDLFNLKNTFFFASIVDNEIASVALILRENNHIYWWIGGTNMKYQQYRPNDVLHWEIIKWGLEQGFKYYDMCGLVLDGNHGPTKFKLGYNGRIIPYYIYNFNKSMIGKIVSRMI